MSETAQAPEVALDKGDDMGAVRGSTATPVGKPVATVQPKDVTAGSGSSGNGQTDGSGTVEYVGGDGTAREIGDETSSEGEGGEGDGSGGIVRKRTWFAYVKTKQFWVVLVLGQGKLSRLVSMMGKGRRKKERERKQKQY